MSPAAKNPPAKSTKSTTAATAQVQPTTDVSEAEAKQNRQFMIIIGGIMAAIVLVGGFISFKLIKSYLHKADQIKAEDKYIHALEDKQKALQELQQNYNDITSKNGTNLSTADIIYHAVPAKPEFKSLIGVIENIGNANGIKASVTATTSPTGATTAPTTTGVGGAADTTTTGSEPVTFGFSVSILSNYDQLITFLQGAEHSLRPMNFKSLNISGQSDSNIQATLQFDTFYQGEADISDKKEPLK